MTKELAELRDTLAETRTDFDQRASFLAGFDAAVKAMSTENERLRKALEFLRDNRIHDSRVTEVARDALRGEK